MEITGVTEEYERHLWDRLNSLLAELIPDDATPAEGERVVTLAIRGHCTEVVDLYEQIRELTHQGAPYLCDRLADDNPVGRASRPIGR